MGIQQKNADFFFTKKPMFTEYKNKLLRIRSCELEQDMKKCNCMFAHPSFIDFGVKFELNYTVYKCYFKASQELEMSEHWNIDQQQKTML